MSILYISTASIQKLEKCFVHVNVNYYTCCNELSTVQFGTFMLKTFSPSVCARYLVCYHGYPCLFPQKHAPPLVIVSSPVFE